MITDITKLQESLVTEAKSKGYPINDIQALRLNKKKDAFEIPISMNTSAKKIEAMLMSMVSNAAIKHKTPGKAYVQGSSAGFLTGATTGKSWEQLTAKQVGSIAFSESFDATTGLKYLRKDPTTGRTLPAQIIMPFFLRGKDKKMLNIDEYTKIVNDKRVLDMDKLDPEVLKLVGARIPNQGHSSMLPMEVVGFLPESMGDLLIVPKEITKQMGSDFDVDSLYTYQYNYDINPTTNAITRVAAGLNTTKKVKVKPQAEEKVVHKKEITTKEAVEMEDQLAEALDRIGVLMTQEGTEVEIENKKKQARDIVEGLEKAKIKDVVSDRGPVTMGDIKFNPQQNDAYYNMLDFLNSDAKAFSLEGYAGTGKTTIIKHLLDNVDKTTTISAPTWAAVSVIEKTTGEKGYTLQALLGIAPDEDMKDFDPTDPKFAPVNDVLIGSYELIVVDEASMINKDLYDFLLSEMKPNQKVIFMGDSAQLPPIGEGESKVFSDTKIGSKLTKVERQSDDNPIGKTYDAIRSNLNSSVDMFPHKTQLNEKGEGIEFYQKNDPAAHQAFAGEAIKAFRKDPKNTKIITWTNASVARYNRDVRAALRPNATQPFESGDLMIMTKTMPIIEDDKPVFANSQELVIKDAVLMSDGGFDYYEMTFEDIDEKHTLNVLAPGAENTAKYKRALSKTVADAKLAVKKGTPKGLAWKAYYALIKGGAAIITTEKGANKGIDYGYAITTHKSQGSTYNNVFIDETDMDTNSKNSERNSLKYVALSRPRTKAFVLTNKGPETPVGEAVNEPDSLRDYEQAVAPTPKQHIFSEKTAEAMSADGKAQLEASEITEKEVEVPSKKSLQNEYIDIHWEVLTDPRVLKRILDPLDKRGDFSIDKEAKKIHAIRSKSGKKTSFLGTSANITSYRQNKGGKDGVGVFSLASTFNAYIQGHNLRLGTMESQSDGSVKEVSLELTMFDGFSLNTLSGPGKNPNGDKASVIMDMQSAAVDNAKEQTLDKINLNLVTFSAANAMAQLHDDANNKENNLDITYITRFMSQKILVDFVEEVQNLSDSTTTDFFPEPNIEAARRLTEKYKDKINGFVASNEDMKHTPDSLIKLIETENEPTNEWYNAQIKVLEDFMILDGIGKEAGNIQSALNTDSKGLGPTFFKVEEKREKIKKLKDSPSIRGTNTITSSFSELGLYSTANATAVEVYGQLLMQGSELTQQTLDNIALVLNKQDKFSAEMKQKAFDGLKSFMLMRKGTIVEGVNGVETERKRLLVDTEDNQSIATRVAEAQEGWGGNNFLLRRLLAKFPETAGNPVSVTYTASSGERVDEAEGVKGFLDMIGSPIEEQAKLGRDLVTYLYLTGGNQSASNFVKFIPSVYLTIANYANSLRQEKWNSSAEVTNSFTTQYLQHNPEVAPAMTKAMEDSIVDSRFVLPSIQELAEKDEASGTVDEANNFIVKWFKDGVKQENYVDFMQFRDQENQRFRLFRKNHEGTDGAEYVEIDIAGASGSISEYRGYGGRIESDYSVNKTATTPQVSAAPKVPFTHKPGNPVINKTANTNVLATYGLSGT
jgi:exodeoxyribonuclease-5